MTFLLVHGCVSLYQSLNGLWSSVTSIKKPAEWRSPSVYLNNQLLTEWNDLKVSVWQSSQELGKFSKCLGKVFNASFRRGYSWASLMKEKETIATSHSSDHPSDYPSFNRLLSSHRELLAALRSAGECKILSTLDETLHHSQEAPPTNELNICALRFRMWRWTSGSTASSVTLNWAQLIIQCSDALLHGRQVNHELYPALIKSASKEFFLLVWRNIYILKRLCVCNQDICKFSCKWITLIDTQNSKPWIRAPFFIFSV